MLLRRKYLIDYIALLLMVIVLVISEEAVPFTRYIYHANDQARPHPAKTESSATQMQE